MAVIPRLASRSIALLLLGLASVVPAPVAAGVCSEAVQGVIAWDGEQDTRWGADNLATLCRGAEESMEPSRCFRAIMSGQIGWGGGTRWNPRNALNLCQGSQDARLTVRCFIDSIARGDHWRDGIAECRGMDTAMPVDKAPPDDSGLPTAHSFGTRDGQFGLGGSVVYRTRCGNCEALYCAPGDEIVSHGGACEFGAIARNYIEQTFDGPCAGIGCWTAHLSCRGARQQPLTVIESRSSIQARCLVVR